MAFADRPVPGSVSVVVVNYCGTDETLTCLEALTCLDFPADRLEIICVDNASGDGSMARLQRSAPEPVVLVGSPRNTGFSGGCNLGAANAGGEFIAFVNNDARPDRRWLAEAVGVLSADSTIGCVASKVLDWEGTGIDYVDAALTWYGMGYKPGAGTPDDGAHEQAKDVLFATGAAMVVRASAFHQAGGFDERFFMFYEDVDLGWRLNLLGHRVRYVPSSIVYHKHHASMRGFGVYSEWFLLERNALMTLYKNVSDDALGHLLAPAMALAVRRSLAVGEADRSVLDLRRSAGQEPEQTATVSRQSLTGAYAIDSFVDLLPSLTETRAAIQRTRVRSDRQLRPLLRQVIEPAIPHDRYLAGHQALVDAFGVADFFGTGRHILVVTGDPLSAKMAGPAIRAFHIATGLAAEHDVRLISTAGCTIRPDCFEATTRDAGGLRPDAAWADIVIFQGFLLTQAPWLARTDKILVPDLYDPFQLEQLEQTRGEEFTGRARDVASTTQALNAQLLRGDFFLCATEQQRHFWLGQLAGLGRLNPKTYDQDPSMRSLLAVVPFGLPDEVPARSASPIKGGEVAGICATDKVILWAGGIYNWLDPLTLLRAVGTLAERHPDLRLYFLGTEHPNVHVPQMRMLAEARALSDTLGLTGKFAFFNEGWVDYEQRHNYLLDADLGVSTHFHHIEATFSFRTRILDYLWAGLPMVVTVGDAFAELVAQRQLGVAVPETDLDALVDALERCVYDDEFAATCRANVARARLDFTWPLVLEPLLAFCRSPQRASDVGQPVLAALAARAAAGGLSDLALARQYLRDGGTRELARRSLGRVRRKIAERRG